MKKCRVAVVGCGALARGAHLPSCRKNPGVELKIVCDIDRNAAEQCRNEFGAERVETDWHKVVEADDIDLCILCTHTNLRGAFIIPALESGKPVYTEKPLAPNRQEMVEIVRTVHRTGKSVCVGHNRRSSPAVLELKRLLDKVLAGAIPTTSAVDRSQNHKRLPEEEGMQMLIRVNDDVRSWKDWIFHDNEGIMFAEMVHFIDLALWFNTANPIRVFAEGSPRGNFGVIFRFADGSITTVQHTMVGHFNYPKELVEITAGNFTLAMDCHMEVRQFGLKDEPHLKTFPFTEDSSWAKKQGVTGYFEEMTAEERRAMDACEQPRWLNVNKGHAEHLNRFIDHIEGKGENPCPVEGAVAVNKIALKVLESARLGLPVAINPEDWHLPF